MITMNNVCFKIRVTGKVQGVFFRHSAKLVAERLGLGGLVRNERDGSVYVEIEGESEIVQKFIGWCRVGPGEADVRKVEVAEIKPTGRKQFNIE